MQLVSATGIAVVVWFSGAQFEVGGIISLVALFLRHPCQVCQFTVFKFC